MHLLRELLSDFPLKNPGPGRGQRRPFQAREGLLAFCFPQHSHFNLRASSCTSFVKWASIFSKKCVSELGMVVYACNPNYSGGRGREDLGETARPHHNQ
jgi:hypothetical protein